jgi:hypothetical protein
MKELVVQSEAIEAIKALGGTGFKLSHRFKVGVSDLLLKIPSYPMALVEVKVNVRPIKSDVVDLNVTMLQLRFLEDFEAAGAKTGILSLLYKGRSTWGAVFPLKSLVYKTKGSIRTVHSHLIQYKEFNKLTRVENLVPILEGFLRTQQVIGPTKMWPT